MLTGLSVQAQDEGLITKQITVQGGSVLQQISQTKKDLITDLKVTGRLSAKDMDFIRSMRNLKNLDMQYIEQGSSDICLKRCYSLEYIKLPSSYAGVMSDSCFFECRYLKSVSFDTGDVYLARCAFMGCSSLERIVFSDGCWVCFLGEECFRGCEKLEDLVISVYLDYWCSMFLKGTFGGCKGLKNLTIYGINNELYTGMYIRADAFEGCPNLETLRIEGEFYIEVDSGAFSNHSKLRDVSLRSSGYSVSCKRNSFENCTNLRKLLVFGKDGVNISNSSFAGCTSLESIEMDGSHVTIGNEAFAGCTSLNSVSCGGTIGNEAFIGCSSLKSIVLVGNHFKLYDEALAGCNDFTLFLTSKMPPTINANAFDQLSSNCTLYVPNGTRDDYWLSPWGDIFANIKEYDATDVKGVAADGKSVIGTYSLDGTVFKVGGKGVAVERDANGKTRKILRK